MANDRSAACAALSQAMLFWKAEQLELNAELRRMADWVSIQNLPRISDSSLLGYRLTLLLDRIQVHFESERRVGKLLAEARDHATQEIEATRGRANREHDSLIARLEQLIASVEANSPSHWETLSHWEKLAVEFGLFVDAMEQHEEQESESIGWLLPNEAIEHVSTHEVKK